MGKIVLKARKNKANGQINFQLKKGTFPKRFKHKLPGLKSATISFKDLEFE